MRRKASFHFIHKLSENASIKVLILNEIQVESLRLGQWRRCYGSLNVYTFY